MSKEENLEKRMDGEYRWKRRNVLDMEDIWCEKEIDRSQPLFYFVPQVILTVKLARLEGDRE